MLYSRGIIVKLNMIERFDPVSEVREDCPEEVTIKTSSQRQVKFI